MLTNFMKSKDLPVRKYVCALFALFLFSMPLHAQEEEAEEDSTYIPAQYPGGDKAMKKYFRKGMQYPDIARSINAEGICFLQFTVNTDGSISDITAKDCKLTRYSQSDLEKYSKEKQEAIKKECIRQMAKVGFSLIHKMKNWTPCMHDGQPVKSKVTVPIEFCRF
jgi:protein TonB